MRVRRSHDGTGSSASAAHAAALAAYNRRGLGVGRERMDRRVTFGIVRRLAGKAAEAAR